MRIFVDTNVIVSAVLARGSLCPALLERILERHTLVISPQVIVELLRALPRCGIDKATTQAVCALLEGRAEYTASVRPADWPCRDEADRRIVQAAIGCDALVTGDRDLLDGPPDPPVRIVDPRACWTLLDEAERLERLRP